MHRHVQYAGPISRSELSEFLAGVNMNQVSMHLTDEDRQQDPITHYTTSIRYATHILSFRSPISEFTDSIVATSDDPNMQPDCVDCGQYTGVFCDGCYAIDRLPQETRWAWPAGWHTPLCHTCCAKRTFCHFCLNQQWAKPPTWGVPHQGLLSV